MTETVLINKLSLCHKHSTGWVRSTLPDVCKSPSSPVPYTNVAYARIWRTDDDRAFARRGDERHQGLALRGLHRGRAGAGGGVISGVHRHQATWLSWSPNVFIEGQPVTRLTDRMLLNKGNTVSLAGYTTFEPGSNEAKICDIACECWVANRGSSRAGPVIDLIPGMTRRYTVCFKNTVDATYPTTAPGVPGSPGLASELGFWDPNDPTTRWRTGARRGSRSVARRRGMAAEVTSPAEHAGWMRRRSTAMAG